MEHVSRIAILSSSAALVAASLLGGQASADSGQTVKPNKAKKDAVVKAWSTSDGGKAYQGPRKCIKVQLSKSNRGVAGLRSNAQKYPKKCAEYGFDGSALLYGSKKKWFLLTQGSSVSKGECRALKNLLEAEAWQDLVKYADGLGCQNID